MFIPWYYITESRACNNALMKYFGNLLILFAFKSCDLSLLYIFVLFTDLKFHLIN